MNDLPSVLRKYELGEVLSEEELEVLANASYMDLVFARTTNVLKELSDDVDPDKLKTYCNNAEAIRLMQSGTQHKR